MSPQLQAEFTDAEQDAIAEADRRFHMVHGDAEADWSPQEEVSYVRLIERVHAVFHADDMAVTS
ncbi:hypothetical protein QMK19_03165 [Streptomyces sp. H10-C2]|uniref:hypothetical protein n=1 Tax=unclassified Streptomyces TaxID=2593676 RepID=UPI0024BAC136|nr:MULTISPECIES: hypothetical protein [unclassified Streptomyces]MDJ0342185.1 hypothetical protein [Streptomyces sp. PH10-H1]MDJ0368699.1 hypothetical protein [Streptomyces sp. H10-C2]